MELKIDDVAQLLDKEVNATQQEDKSIILSDLHMLMIELEAHIGRKIRIGNNAFAPLNEEDYTLEGYKVFKCKDGQYQVNDGYSLIVTVKDKNDVLTSFIYPLIFRIDSSLLPGHNRDSSILKYHIHVRNKNIDAYKVDSEHKSSYYSEEVTKLLQKLTFDTYRFFLYD